MGATPPHVSSTGTNDSCAICHRLHTATTDLPVRVAGSVEPTGNALVLSLSPFSATSSDSKLCYLCHGVGSLGSSFDVESSFSLASTHAMAPSVSAYGPSLKMCGSCHDSHGSDQTASGTPYPALLRTWADTSTLVFSGEEYCASCHAARAGSRWDGLGVYKATGHFTGMPAPARGTGIRCSQCHASHGSDVAPLVIGSVTPPAAPATATLTANDRGFCLACHPTPSATWSGETTYSASAHALSTATVAVGGEWSATGAVRPVGECQVCHDPMGRTDGAGGAIPKLAEKAGRALCDTCHRSGGVASKDLASLAYPSSESTAPELVAVWSPDQATAWAGRAAVFGRALTGAQPRPLTGPREYRTASGRTGAAAAGDIDLDGRAELVVADPAAATVTVFERDAQRGLTRDDGPGTLSLPNGRPADLLAVADVTLLGADWAGRAEIVVVNRADGLLWIYRYTGSQLTTVAGPLAAGSAPTGIATGDVTGTVAAQADIAVTDDGADELLIFTEGSGEITTTVAPTQPGPRGPSIGDAWERGVGDKDEIVVVNSAAATATVSVFDGSGERLADFTADPGTAAGAVPVASAIGDILPARNGGSSGMEIAVSLVAANGDSTVDVWRQLDSGSGPGWVGPPDVVRSTGARSGSGSLLVGDVEVDGTDELVVGNGGVWARGAGFQAPSVAVYRPDGTGTSLDPGAPDTYAGGALELAGAAPSLVLADFGAVVPSRHPVDVSTAHVSTETASFTRHVTCSDCHDSHEATTTASAAPSIKGPSRGAWGVAVTNSSPTSVTYAAAARAQREYENCMKCHSASTALGSRADLGGLVNPLNPSVHAIEASSTDAQATDGSFTPGWSNDSILYCTDCHANADTSAAKGPHVSSRAPVLASAYAGTGPSDATMLCFRCHEYDTYYTSATDGVAGSTSNFYDTTYGAARYLHSRHVGSAGLGGLGFGCGSCHVSHGSQDQPHLIGASAGYTHGGGGTPSGSCTNDCHTTGTGPGGHTQSYTFTAP